MNDNPKFTPPHVTFINMAKAAYIMHQEDPRKAHVIFLPRDLSKKMEVELDKKDMTLDKFVFDACLDFLRMQEAKKAEMRDYLFFNDLRVTQEINIPSKQKDPIDPFWGWSDDDSSGEDTVILHKLEADESGSAEETAAANRIVGDIFAGKFQ